MSNQIAQLKNLLLSHVTHSNPLDISNIRNLFNAKYGHPLECKETLADYLKTHFSKLFTIKKENSAVKLYLKEQPTNSSISLTNSTATTRPSVVLPAPATSSSSNSPELTPFGSIIENDALEKILKEKLNTGKINPSQVYEEYYKRTGRKLQYSGKFVDALCSVPRLSNLFHCETGQGGEVHLIPSKIVKNVQHKMDDAGLAKQPEVVTKKGVETKPKELPSVPIHQSIPTLKSYTMVELPITANTSSATSTTLIPTSKVSLPQNFSPNTFVDNHNVYLIDTIEAAQAAMNWLSNFDTVACDIEFTEYDQTTSLIQLATSMFSAPKDVLFSKQHPIVFLFDMLCKDKQAFLTLLKQSVFENSSILKIFHDARHDCEILWKQASIRVRNVADTQVQYKYLTNLQKMHEFRQTQRVLDLPTDKDRIGLNSLLQKCILTSNSLKKEFQTIFTEQTEYWKQRPLDKKAMQYAAMDVTQLIPLYSKLNQQIAASNVMLIGSLSNAHVLQYCPELGEQEHPISISFDDSYQLITAEQPESVDIVFEEQLTDLIETINDLEGSTSLLQHEKRDELSEIVLDYGRQPLARFMDDSEIFLNNQLILLEQLQIIQDRLSQFGPDNRSGLTNTLHRFSRLLNKKGEIVGLTIRVGKTLNGMATIFQDIICNKKNSVLIVSEPGSGKTTILRDLAKFVADEIRRRVVIVDTSNEIGGDGDCPHRSIGSARRMQVLKRNLLHETMIEAVQNHNPQTVVIDEIGNGKEVMAAKSIQTRGVQMIATAHGTLVDLLNNPELNGLLGGLQTVTLGDMEMKARNLDTKTLVERRGSPCFNVIIEILGFRKWRVFMDTATVIDNLLKRNRVISNQIRFFNEKNEMMLLQKQILENFDDEKMQAVISKTMNQTARPSE